MEDKIIIEAVQRGETETFGLLVSRYQPKMFALIISLIGYEHEEEAKDILQDSFVKAFLAIGQFRGQSSFATWIYRITYNETMGYIRTRRRRNIIRFDQFDMTDEPMDDSNDEESPLEQIQPEELQQALQALKEADRALLIFYYQENMSIKDIAYVSKLTETNVKVKLFRLRKKLLKLLRHE